MKQRRSLYSARRVLEIYIERVTAFQPNARLYLVSVMISGIATGIFRLIFNFYVLSQGYDEALLGNLVTTSSLTALLAALPMGYLADVIGRKTSLILGACGITLAILAMVMWPSVPVFVAMNILLGLAQSLAGVTMGPFLMENSGDVERTYLFSFGAGMQMGSVFVGNWLGGILPTWMGAWQGIGPTTTQAYGMAMGVTVLLNTAGTLPLLLMRSKRLALNLRSASHRLTLARREPGTIGRLILPMLITSVGAGLIMPFMNVFFRQTYHQSDPVIGALMAWGSLSMGIGMLLAPALADRTGKIQLVVITQTLSIPFLFMLGFSPIFSLSAMAYFIRNGLMNMTGPVYQTFVMEHVEPDARATIASLASMASNFGWALSPTVSGWIQVNYGFQPAFAGTIILYIVSIYLYWKYFWPRKKDLNQDYAFSRQEPHHTQS